MPVNPDQSERQPKPDEERPPARRPGLLQVAKTMFFGVLMIGKKATWEKGGEGAGWVNAGIYVLPRSFLEAIPARPASLEHEILPAWIAREPGRVYCTQAYFCDIGTPERWRKACAELPRAAAGGVA